MARIKLYFESGRVFLILLIYIRMLTKDNYYVAERENKICEISVLWPY